MAEGQKQIKEGSQGMNEEKKILQTYLPINYEVKTESERRWGGGEACFEANIQEISKQQAFLKILLFTLHL